MKKTLVILALAIASISIQACTTTPTAANIKSITSPLSATVADEKGLIIAENAFAGISLAIQAGIDAGLVKGDTAVQIDAAYVKAEKALSTARLIRKGLSAGSLEEQVALALSQIGFIGNLLGE